MKKLFAILAIAGLAACGQKSTPPADPKPVGEKSAISVAPPTPAPQKTVTFVGPPVPAPTSTPSGKPTETPVPKKTVIYVGPPVPVNTPPATITIVPGK